MHTRYATGRVPRHVDSDERRSFPPVSGLQSRGSEALTGETWVICPGRESEKRLPQGRRGCGQRATVPQTRLMAQLALAQELL